MTTINPALTTSRRDSHSHHEARLAPTRPHRSPMRVEAAPRSLSANFALSLGDSVVSPRVTMVNSVALAQELARHLLDPARQKPVVLVTRPRGRAQSWIDVARVADEVSGVAEVYEMPTSGVSWAFSEELAEFPGAECYGGAGRVYPPGLAWTVDLNRAPLRLVASDAEADRATERLIDDTLTAAYSAGFTTSTPTTQETLPANRGGLAVSSSADELEALHREVDRLREACTSLVQEANRQQQLARAARTALDQAEKTLSGVQSALDAREADARAFSDPDLQFRHEVYLAWARRVPGAEKAALPLRDYSIGPGFLASLEDRDRAKAVSVAMEVITGRADALAGRATHPLRVGPGAGDPVVRRADGALCWRVSLQHQSPQARRLHYWRLPDGTVELSSVRPHDSARP